MKRLWAVFALGTFALGYASSISCAPALAQQLSLPLPGVGNQASAQQFVASTNGDALNVVANKPSVVELRFRVNPGLHVHSHTPSSEFYIPTTFKLSPGSGVSVTSVAYPAGETYSFSFDPKEKLSVYSGAFTVKATLVASAGSHMLHAALRYQACDNAACFPPKTLPVDLVVVAR